MAPDRTDDLLKPSVRARPAGDPPWRLGSQVYVAFFGGVLAVTAIAYFNAQRLGLDQGVRLRVLGAGVLGVCGLLAAAVLVEETDTLRLVTRGIGLLTYGLLYLIQRVADRIHQMTAPDDDPYDSLWAPGIAAVVAGALIQAGFVAAIGSGAA